MRIMNVGLLGLGTVGSGVYDILKKKSRMLKERSGIEFRLVKAADKSPARKKALGIPSDIFTRDAGQVIRNPEIDVVIELIGGISPAKGFIIESLKNGKDVITANKALLAEQGKDIFKTAAKCGKKVLFEASVAGGIPVIKGLREGLVGNRIKSVFGIINGTCNYILTKMTRDGIDFDRALQIAKDKGYAETNPKLDIDGVDSAHKLTILAELAYNRPIQFKDVYCEGIRNISSHDISFAKNFGCVIKLLAIAKKVKGGIECRVQPTLLSQDHILAKVDGSFNAVLFSGDETGDVLLYGKGAGSRPTASAIISDLVDLGRSVVSGGGLASDRMPALGTKKKGALKNIASIKSRYYMRFSVTDKPGVLASISGIFGSLKVSISDVMQTERKLGNVVPLIFLTHHTNEKDVREAMRRITALRTVHGKPQLIRLES